MGKHKSQNTRKHGQDFCVENFAFFMKIRWFFERVSILELVFYVENKENSLMFFT